MLQNLGPQPLPGHSFPYQIQYVHCSFCSQRPRLCNQCSLKKKIDTLNMETVILWSFEPGGCHFIEWHPRVLT